MKTRQKSSIKFLILTILSSFILLTVGYGADNSSLAILKKIVNDVKKKSQSSEYVQATLGVILISGDQVQTGKKSLAIIKFTEGSIVRLREQSELTLKSEGQKGSMIRESNLMNGSVGFDVQKQRMDQFRLTSPTSVASIRGTKGKWSGGRGHDTLVVTEGLVNLKNNISNKDIDIAAGYIGFSDEDGSLTSRKATDEELADANIAALGGTINELKLEMKDSKGNKKDLKLRYKQ
jgi:hypothetical protein